MTVVDFGPPWCFPCLTGRCAHPEHSNPRTLANLAGGNQVPVVTYSGGSALCEDCAIREAAYLPEPRVLPAGTGGDS